eukprot:4157362-Amphidinium_carterae.1
MEWSREEDEQRCALPENRASIRWRNHVHDGGDPNDQFSPDSDSDSILVMGPEVVASGSLEGSASACERTGRCPPASREGPDPRSRSQPEKVDVAIDTYEDHHFKKDARIGIVILTARCISCRLGGAEGLKVFECKMRELTPSQSDAPTEDEEEEEEQSMEGSLRGHSESMFDLLNRREADERRRISSSATTWDVITGLVQRMFGDSMMASLSAIAVI